MATGQHADQDAVDYVLLSNDDFADFVSDLIELGSGGLEGGGGGHVLILDGRKGLGFRGESTSLDSEGRRLEEEVVAC